ncbi:MAG: DUF4347 domain-containing protein, partial [Methyloglobulus sp.]|nr:DUF4347 domain-containing protein [Methyloglobulus sp.]
MKKNKIKQIKQASASSMRLALENRLLFDGAIAATADSIVDDKAASQAAEAQDASQDVSHDATNSDANLFTVKGFDFAQQPPIAFEATSLGADTAPVLIIADAKADGLAELIKNPPINAQIKVLDSKADGYQQIADILQARGSTTDIRILTAQRDGKEWLATSAVNPTMTLSDQNHIADWGDGLTGDANITVYGHQNASQHWLHQMSALSGANVAWTDSQRASLADDLQKTGANSQTDKTSVNTTASQERAAVTSTTNGNTFVFVDKSVSDYQTLLKGFDSNAKIILLDPNQDGMHQIAGVLSQYGNVGSVHIISHGGDGFLNLGNSTFSFSNFQSYSNDLASIRGALSADADILLYGCDVAASGVGDKFIHDFATATGADVAASVDATGATSLGGNWNLEDQVGLIQTKTIMSSEWDHLMVNTVINSTGGVLANGSDGLRISITNLGQIQIKYQNQDQLYLSGTSDTSPNLFNGIYMAVGSQVIGPDTGAEGMTKVAWKSVGLQTLTGTGTSADPFVVSTKLYYDVNNNNVYDVASDFQVQVNTNYVLSNRFFTENVTITAPSSNTQAIKYYHAIDTFLAGGDNGPAFSLDPSLAQTNNTTGDPYFVGVRKGVGTANESMVGFVETGTTQFDHYYSSSYNGLPLYGSGSGNGVGIAGGGDIANTWNIVAATDNGLGVQMNAGVLTTTKTLNYIIAFDGDTQLDLDANNSTTTGTGYLGTFSPGTSNEVSVVDTDVTITNVIGDIPDVMVTLTNAQTGDLFSINSSLLPTGITVEALSSNKIRLVGIATEADYQAALQLIKFSTSGTSTVDRVFTIAVHNQLNSTVTSATSTLTALAVPIVDLNSGTATAAVPTTSNVIINTGFSDFADVPYGWTEGGTATGMAADGAANGRYVFTFDTAADTLTQSGLAGLNIGPGLNGAGQVTLDLGFVHGDNVARTMDISVGGVVYARLTTGLGTGTAGSITYLGGATNAAGDFTATTITQMANATSALSSITINLPSSVAASGSLVFTTTSAGDDIIIDNVLLRTSTTSLIDVTNGNDFATTFTENGAAVSISDTDNTVRDGDSANMVSGLVTLTNAQTGDQLLVGGSAAASGTINGINYTNTGTVVTLTGSATKANYEATIRAITFNNTSDNSSTTPRIINTKVNDGTFDSNIAVTTINVVPVNDAPVANADTGAINEDATLTQSAANGVIQGTTGGSVADTDPDNATNTLVVSGAVAGTGAVTQNVGVGASLAGTHGHLTLNADGSYSYVADNANSLALGVTATDTFTYTVQDPGGLVSNTATLTITVTGTNDAPTAVNDTASTNEDIPLTIPVATLLANDTDPDTGDTLTVTSVQGAVNGTVSLVSGVVTFTPTAHYNGPASFTYTISDGKGGTSTATVNVTVEPVNDAPAGADSVININEDSSYTIVVSDFGFTDPNDSPANTFTNIVVASLPPTTEGVYNYNGAPVTVGQIISVANINLGLLTFTPALNVNNVNAGGNVGALGFQVQDNGGGVNTDPTANTIQFNIAPLSDLITIGGLNDGTVANTDAQVKESDLASGTNPGGNGESATGTFSIGPSVSLTSVTINTQSITKAQFAASGTTPIVITGTHGDLTITGYNTVTGVVSYGYTLTSAANHAGGIVNDTFTITSLDIDGSNNSDQLAINIVDDAPVINADVDEAINIPSNPSSTASGNVVTGIGGIDPNNADGAADNLGADGAVSGSPSPVTGVVAGAGSPLAGNVGVAVNGTYGSLTLNADGSYVYTPDTGNTTVQNLLPGTTIIDTFTYGIGDNDGDNATTTLTITIVGVPTVVGLNDGTVAGTDASVLESNLASGSTPGTGDTTTGSLLLVAPTGIQSFTIDGTILTLAQLQALAPSTPETLTTANGTLILTDYNDTTGALTYEYTLTNPATSSGIVTDDFQVSLVDGAGNNTITGPVKFLKIAIIDDAPSALPDTNAVSENDTNPITGDVIINDKIGADGSIGTNNPVTDIMAGVVGIPSGNIGTSLLGSYGSITLSADGAYSYVVDNANLAVNALQSGGSLTDIFTYQITDKDGDTATATIAITINGSNDAPVAVIDTASTNEDIPLTIPVATLLANDTDPDTGDTLTVTSVQAATNGTVSLVSGVVTFTPTNNYNGPASFTYTISDGHGGTSAATVNITVDAVNDPPVNTVPGSQVATEDTSLSIPGLAVADIDSASLTTTLSVDNGVLTLATLPLGVVITGNDTGTVTLSGSPSDINTALASLSYQGNLNFNGSDTLTVSTNDGVNSAVVDTVTISIDPVADPFTATLTHDSTNDTGSSTTDSITSNSSPAISGTGVPGETMTLFDKNGVLVGTAIVDAGGIWSINPVGNYLSEGLNNLTVTATDPYGNTGLPITVPVTLDVAAPVPTLSVNAVTADNILNAAEAGGTIAVTGTVGGDYNTGDTVTLVINGTTYTGTVTALGAFSIDVAGSDLAADPDATIAASVATTDAAGNPGSASDTQAYTVDVTAPVPTLSVNAVTADNILNAAEAGGTIAVTGTVGGDYNTGDTV